MNFSDELIIGELPVGPMAQLVEHCGSITGVRAQIPIQAFLATAYIVIAIHSSNKWNSCIKIVYIVMIISVMYFIGVVSCKIYVHTEIIIT